MSGNLSHQIEHHMFPDVPSNKYIEVAPRVRAICERYGLHYETGPMPQQLASVWHKVFVYALPNGQQLTLTYNTVTGASALQDTTP